MDDKAFRLFSQYGAYGANYCKPHSIKQSNLACAYHAWTRLSLIEYDLMYLPKHRNL